MKVLEVIKQAVKYLGETDLMQTTTLGGAIAPTDLQTEKINTLIDCVNDTVQSLATMYFPLKYEEVVSSASGVYSFDLFAKPLLDILAIIDNRLKFSVNYAMFADHFEAKAGSLRVTYSYLPSEVSGVNDDIEVVENKVTARMVALGVLSRYFLIVGMYQDANNWEQTFARAVLVAQRRKDNVVLKKRRWI